MMKKLDAVMKLTSKNNRIEERSLYPNTIFHFTNDNNVILDIIKAKYFRASYAKEVIVGPNGTKRTFGIPMVSFCDIRLSNLNEHMKKYGYYGIGLKKSWAIKEGLNPVSYLNPNCSMFQYFDEQLRYMSEELLSIDEKDKHKVERQKYLHLQNVMRYMKNYEGALKRGEEHHKKYRFANESEWRYVPDITTPDIIPVKIVEKNNSNWKAKANQALWASEFSRLRFEYSDIKYILIPTSYMAFDLIEGIKEFVSDEEYIYLISKIFDSRSIYQDL
ncbi:hypothetical protein B9J96_10545 [Enterobacter roggenkampii]|nr:hypothetical protein B9J96_10545 [Enterobacter roggenkampii]